jgi:hypothetical protein
MTELSARVGEDQPARPQWTNDPRYSYLPRPRVRNPQPHDHRADSQEVQRERRRKRLAVELDERFVLSAEVAAIFADVAAQMSYDPNPGRWVVRLDRALRSDPALRNEGNPERVDDALSAIARAVHMPAPDWPLFGAESIAEGSWLAELVEAVRPLDGPLSEYLAAEVRTRRERRAEVGDTPTLERLRTLDRAARELSEEFRRLTAGEDRTPPPADPMDALRRKHSREREKLRERQAAEWAEASAAVKAARIAAQAAK